jgi:hypothetical protein
MGDGNPFVAQKWILLDEWISLTRQKTGIIPCVMKRRAFLHSGAVSAGAAAFSTTQRSFAAKETAAGITKESVILFQGDSITDAGRAMASLHPHPAQR